MISIIHPSRSRARQAEATARKWLDNAGCDVEHILSIDFSDPNKKDYYNSYFLSMGVVCKNNLSAVGAINEGAKQAQGNILIVLSDDFDCPPLWGKKILDATEGKKDWILKTPDGIQKWIITMPIMDRTYYERFNYIYHPDYLHMFCDTELTCVADLTGRKIEANIPFTHNHYSTGKTPQDEVSRRADASWNHGEKLFIEREKRNFDLPLKDLKGKIQNQDYLNWMRRKGQ